MATQFIFRNTQTHGITLTSPAVTNLYDLGRDTFGSNVDTCITDTQTGASLNIQMTKTAAGASVGWISEPFPQAVTITTGTANLWFEESNMSANCQVGIQFYRWTSGTTATVIGGGVIPFGTEAAFAGPREDNFSTNFTDQAFNIGDRLVILLYVSSSGTMATGFTGTFTFNAASGQTGDSFFSLNETLGFPLFPNVTDTVALNETLSVTQVHKPQLGESLTLTDTATAGLWESQWYGAANLLEMPHIADTVTISDGCTVIIPSAAIAQIPVADQVNVTDAAAVLLPIYPLSVNDQVTASEIWTVQSVLMPVVTDALALSDVVTAVIGNWMWSGTMDLLVQPHSSDGISLVDVQTVGNERYAEIAWIEMELPASSTEIDVPFGLLQSGQIQIHLKYRGSSNKVRAILATNVCGNAGTFIINDNGTEHLVTIPDGIIAQEIALDEEVTLGNGVSCRVKTEKVAQ